MLTYELDMLRAELATARAERDAARRELCCVLAERAGSDCDLVRARRVADGRGWDCFGTESTTHSTPIVVLSDGETFDVLENCTVVAVPEAHAASTEAIEEYLKARQ